MLPVCCRPLAFHSLERGLGLVHDSLLHGAVAVALHHEPKYKVADVDTFIQYCADTVRRHLKSHRDNARLAHLHEVLFEEMHLAGNVKDFQNIQNQFLPAVVNSRLGSPVILSMIYVLVARRLGFKSWGVALPGHFIAGIKVDGHRMLVDSFNGGKELTVQEAQEVAKSTFQDFEWEDSVLNPVSDRSWITRILQNLLNTYGPDQKFEDMAAMVEMEILMWPDMKKLHKDLGLILARIGKPKEAIFWLVNYIRECPEDPQNSDLRQLVNVLEK